MFRAFYFSSRLPLPLLEWPASIATLSLPRHISYASKLRNACLAVIYSLRRPEQPSGIHAVEAYPSTHVDKTCNPWGGLLSFSSPEGDSNSISSLMPRMPQRRITLRHVAMWTRLRLFILKRKPPSGRYVLAPACPRPKSAAASHSTVLPFSKPSLQASCYLRPYASRLSTKLSR